MTATPRILILYAHPAPHLSRVNHRLTEAARAVPNVKVRDLYETYPDFDIDVKQEQALLTESDLIVFQHPIQWYSMPSLLKEWVDVVLEYGWAYGHDSTALKGKDFWLVTTTGSPGTSYQEDAYHGHAFSAFLPPIRQTAVLCGMHWLPPLILHGARRADDSAVDAHVDTYRQLLLTYPNWPERVVKKAHFPERRSRQE
jgi:glutathione-regulated potassium-efflux system ancillary protein KefF